MSNIIGIYKITNEVNNKIYVGSSFNIVKRFGEHQRDLAANRHSNRKLQRAYNKYGKSAFKYEILKEFTNITDKELRKVEGEFSFELNSYSKKSGYNLIIENGQGRHPTEETLRKMRKQSLLRKKPVVIINIYNLKETWFPSIGDALMVIGVNSNVRFTKSLLMDGNLHLTAANYEIYRFDLDGLIKQKLLERTEKSTGKPKKYVIDVNTGVFYDSPEEVSQLYGFNGNKLRWYKTFDRWMIAEDIDYKKQKNEDDYRRACKNSLANSKYSILDLETGIYYDNFVELSKALFKRIYNVLDFPQKDRFSVINLTTRAVKTRFL